MSTETSERPTQEVSLPPADAARRLLETINRRDWDALRRLDAPDVVDDFVAIGVKAVSLRGIDVMRFEDGKLVHHTIYYDGLTFARQIGLLPVEGGRADRAMQAAFNTRTDVLARLARLFGHRG